MRFKILTLLSISLATPGAAFAEGGCPPGQIPYSGTSLSSCGPIPSTPSRQPEWESRWGAIATDLKGTFGIATGLTSERRAKKEALADCRGRGATSCTADFTFRDQCAAVVNSTTRTFSQSAATEAEAIQIGQSRCAASASGKCWVFYSGCSLPVKAR